jgi:predicted enzyme related to lactoylglutathione lyase
MRTFPVQDMMTDISGAIFDTEGFHKSSSTDGVLIYLNGNPDVQNILNKVESAGSSIFCPKQRLVHNMVAWQS